MSQEHRGPRTVLNSLGRLAGTYEAQCSAGKRDLEIAQGRLRDCWGRLDKHFGLAGILFKNLRRRVDPQHVGNLGLRS
jgi:hypothetical protein